MTNLACRVWADRLSTACVDVVKLTITLLLTDGYTTIVGVAVSDSTSTPMTLVT
jgi:hypothetical protein